MTPAPPSSPDRRRWQASLEVDFETGSAVSPADAGELLRELVKLVAGELERRLLRGTVSVEPSAPVAYDVTKPEWPVEHKYVRLGLFPQGWVAWCSCGMGSPPQSTTTKAEASLAVHTDDPRVFPS